MNKILDSIDEFSAQIRFDSIDFSIAELIRLYKDEELIIQPAYQRMFRWDDKQQSRFVESLLIGLPVPQIVIFQNEEGIYELIDGLQRVSSILRFVARIVKSDEDTPKTIPTFIGCDIMQGINGQSFEKLDKVVQLELKRRVIRAVVIRRTNDPTIRYQMFKRLNGGGSIAEPQEIRNASLRIFGKAGEDFLNFIDMCVATKGFQSTTIKISKASKQQLGLEELAIRFIALKHDVAEYKGNITDFLDSFSEKVVKSVIDGEPFIDYDVEIESFAAHFDRIDRLFGPDAFVRFRKGYAVRSLAPAYFEAVSLGLLHVNQKVWSADPSSAVQKLGEIMDPDESADFAGIVGPGANSAKRLNERIEYVRKNFDEFCEQLD